MWISPSLIYHSSAANLTRFVLGHDQHYVMLIRASEDIQTGEELTISYV